MLSSEWSMAWEVMQPHLLSQAWLKKRQWETLGNQEARKAKEVIHSDKTRTQGHSWSPGTGKPLQEDFVWLPALQVITEQTGWPDAVGSWTGPGAQPQEVEGLTVASHPPCRILGNILQLGHPGFFSVLRAKALGALKWLLIILYFWYLWDRVLLCNLGWPESYHLFVLHKS